MAIANAECVCSRCGQHFTCRTFRHKRRDTDSFEVWGEEHVDICPPCRIEMNFNSWEAEAMECVKLAKKLRLPELTGTEKQIMSAEYTRIHIFESGPEEGGEELFCFILDTCTSAKWWIAHKQARTMKDLRFLMKYSTADKTLLQKWQAQEAE